MPKAAVSGSIAKHFREALDILGWVGLAFVAIFKVFLHATWGTAILTTSLIVVVLAGLWVAVAAYRSGKAKAPTLTMHHPVLGLTRVLPNRSWESDQVIEPGKPPVTFSSQPGYPSPTEIDVANFENIKRRWPSLLEAAHAALKESCQNYKISLSPADLQLESVVLDPEEGSFTLSFEAPALREQLQWGLYADFADYKVFEADVLH